MRRFVVRHTGLMIFLLYFICGAYVLYSGCSQRLFSYPPYGTDQRSILECAMALTEGKIPETEYRYSYAYTIFLSLLSLFSCGKLWLIRLLQLAVCSLIPVVIMRSVRLLGWGRNAALIGALIFLFYAPSLLITLDFLRASPLALAFLLQIYFLLLAWFRERRGSKSLYCYMLSGFFGALCVLGRENFLAVSFLPLLFFIRRDFWREIAAFLSMLILPLAAVIVFNGIRYNSWQLVPGNVGNIMNFYAGSYSVAGAAGNLLASIPGHLRDFMLSYELHNSLSVYAHREVIPALRIFFIPFNLLLAAAAIGSILRIRERGVLLCTLLAAAYVASMLFFTIFYRFRIPLVPIFAILAAGVVGGILRLWCKKKRILCVSVVAIATIFCIFTTVDPDSRRLPGERISVLRVLVFNQRLAEAENYLEDMYKDGAGDRNAAWEVVRALHATGDRDGAMRVFLRYCSLPKKR